MITREELNQVRQKAAAIRAMVIGDVMLDQYIFGTVNRISPEAPVPVVNLQRTDLKAGGAANVAVNLAAWGCQTAIIGMVGKDKDAERLTALMKEKTIQPCWIETSSRPTTVKTRVVAATHHLLRIDQESTDYLQGEEEKNALQKIEHQLQEFKPDLIILEDYNKGLLTDRIISAILKYGHDHKVFLAVDPKEKLFFAYTRVQLFKPNLREASQASGRPLQIEDLPALSETLRAQQSIQTLAITLGPKGIYLKDGSAGTHVRPDRPVDIVDVCGAGDAVIVSLALGLMGSLSLEKCGSLANLAGAYVCSHSGVVAVDVDEIYQWI